MNTNEINVGAADAPFLATVSLSTNQWVVLLDYLDDPEREMHHRDTPSPRMLELRNSIAAQVWDGNSDSPSQRVHVPRDSVLAAIKWLERINQRKADLPASFLDNTDPLPLAKSLRAALAECRKEDRIGS